jgi:hypothetical protein
VRLRAFFLFFGWAGLRGEGTILVMAIRLPFRVLLRRCGLTEKNLPAHSCETHQSNLNDLTEKNKKTMNQGVRKF